ncbi:MAG: 30S ribosomal protein S16 [Candidatus Doudnabacteria bacterium RIFCSPHIGHO2_02_FULL_46_11]|uniref:30S ribosomal protein S16 n=1 Tax=Candidatus Doudnabacteria bacterium RIFCSPHIGHO2_02_FULL_46_11 TaxID=1817832 RepID=A0A1F5P8Y7_9BACT|nr:MAG: 30S ribosomal protein S16 [Candidatus Doudnabacteria bacterium RIFCSPHIGHO2_02_FULL_46_11]
MLIIRLQRIGKKHQPQFRIVLAQKTKAASKKFLEILGNYNPRNKEFKISDQARLEYWLGQNVEVSATVHNLFVTNKVVKEGVKVKAWRPKKSEKPAEAATPAAATNPPAGGPVAEAAPAEQTPAPEETPAVDPDTKQQ